MKNSSYHNTNNEQGILLLEYEEKALTQEKKIIEIFRKFPNRTFTPEEIHKMFNGTPITSIRRAISNLSNPRKWNTLEKTDEMRKGYFGRKVHAWKLKK